jgi:uncharacterized protein
LSSRSDGGTPATLIDCDVHTALKKTDVLRSYLPRRWHAYYDQIPARLPIAVQTGAKPHASIFRQDVMPADGGTPGSDLHLMSEQLLEKYGVQKAVLSPLEIFDWVQYGDFGLALTTALNDWLVDEWLERDPRMFGSIVVPQEDGVRAAAEIERAAADDRFVQVLLAVRTAEPLGHPNYWPIYAAATAHDLPVAVHVGGYPRAAETGAGWPTYYLEHHIAWPYAYHAHVVSLIHSGVFERFPTLQIVLEEGGIAWMTSLMWRLDRAWESMRDLAPHIERRPSATIRAHFWFTTQPMEETADPAHLVQMLDHLDMDNRIMFASDYPHWDFDAPSRALPAAVTGERRRKIFASNAASLYRFEAGR